MNDCTKLMIDRAMGSVQKYSLSEADDAIRAYFYELLGVDEGCTREEIREAFRKNNVAIYEAIEETIEAMFAIRWGEILSSDSSLKKEIMTETLMNSMRWNHQRGSDTAITIEEMESEARNEKNSNTNGIRTNKL